MAQTNYTPIILYNSGTTTNAPSAGNLANGELAINYTDGKLFYKDNANAIQVIGWKTTPTTAGGTGLTSYTAGDLPYYASGTALSKLGIGTSGYVLESNGSAPTWVAQSTLSVGSATNATNTAITDNTSSSATWYPTIVSATTGNLPQTTSSTKLSFVPSTGTLTATNHAGAWAGNTIGTGYGGTGLTSFTSNGVVYASSSSVLATGSALTFDGTNLYVGTTTQYDGGVITALNTTNNAVVGFRNSYASGGNPIIGYWRLTGQVGSTSNYILIGNTLTTGDTIYIYGNGNIVNKNNSYGTLSDAKLKTNVVLADTQWNDVKALGQVMKKFKFLTDPANSPLQLGWVAQDVQTISPGLVFSSPDRDDEGKTLETTSLGVNTSVAMLKAFKALSEALVRIENLETALTNAKISIPNT